MREFNILHPEERLEGALLLEASAGTGKTFAIEHSAVRLLLEGQQPLEIEQLLLVTFTRAATADLKARLRANLIEALAQLEAASSKETLFPYLRPIVEGDPSLRQQARRRLRRALMGFDKSAIYTIHGFCQRLLEEEPSLASYGSIHRWEAPVSTAFLEQLVRDVLRSQLDRKLFHPLQLQLLLDGHEKQTEQLIERLIYWLEQTSQPEPPLSHESAQAQLWELWQKHRSSYSYEVTSLMAQFNQLLGRRKGLRQLSFLREKAERFALLLTDDSLTSDRLFEQLLVDGLVWHEVEGSEARGKGDLLKEKGLSSYPELLPFLRQHLHPLLEPQRNPHHLLMRLLERCHLLLEARLEVTGLFRYDDLLRKSLEACRSSPALTKAIRHRYRAVIVDEFQDTDAVQWALLRHLFLETAAEEPWQGALLLLVGDPKQSIYSFRQADIYTYLKASRELGSEATASLQTNWRAHPRLVAALNGFFAKAHPFLELPSWQEALPYQPVKAGCRPEERSLLPANECLIELLATESSQDELLNLHHLVAEIRRLQMEQGVSFDSWAVLVYDRWQAERTAQLLAAHGIASQRLHSASGEGAAALIALRELLLAIAQPRQIGWMKAALLGRLFRWSPQELFCLQDSPQQLEQMLALFIHWKALWQREGIACLLQKLFKTPRHLLEPFPVEAEWAPEANETLAGWLSSTDPAFAESLWTLIRELIGSAPSSIEQLLRWLDGLEKEPRGDSLAEQLAKKRLSPAVHIVTIHSSKGLEYELVYGLGLIVRPPRPAPFLLEERSSRRWLLPVAEESQAYQQKLAEQEAELVRLFYVATTRARYRLYLPVKVTGSSSRRNLSQKMLSPMELWMARWSSSSLPTLAQLEEEVSKLQGQGIGLCLRQLKEEPSRPSTLSFCSLEEPGSSFGLGRAQLPLALRRRAFLAGKAAEQPSHRAVGVPLGPPQTPPASELEVSFRQLLGQLPFSFAKQPELLRQQLLARTSQLEATEAEALFERVHALVAMELPSLDGPLRLCDLPSSQLVQDEELVHYTREGCLQRSLIDLVFCYRSHFYLLQWKNDLLPYNCDENSLMTLMQAQGYLKEEEIHRQALCHRLDRLALGSHSFGGSYYVFVQGALSDHCLVFLPAPLMINASL